MTASVFLYASAAPSKASFGGMAFCSLRRQSIYAMAKPPLASGTSEALAARHGALALLAGGVRIDCGDRPASNLLNAWNFSHQPCRGIAIATGSRRRYTPARHRGSFIEGD